MWWDFTAKSAVKEVSKLVNSWQSYRHEGGMSHVLCKPGHLLLKCVKFARYLEYGDKQFLLTVVTDFNLHACMHASTYTTVLRLSGFCSGQPG